MSAAFADLLRVPPERARELARVLERLLDARRVALTTHVNADADGVGSESAVAAWLEERGAEVTIVNPTPFPEALRFLLHRPGLTRDWGSPGAGEALEQADLVLVLDTSEPGRVEPLAEHLEPARTLVIDHHLPGRSAVGELCVRDPSAAATGELVYDLLTLAGDPWPAASVVGAYVAIVSDTGSFRYSNTTPRTHAVAADLLLRGADPETVYQRLHATVPLRRLDLLRRALERLEVDPAHGIAWITVPEVLAAQTGARGEDFDGLIDHARSIEDTRVALLFRETGTGATKVSFRANGDTDVNAIARAFQGGGHAKASGATVEGDLEDVVPRVLARVRAVTGERVSG